MAIRIIRQPSARIDICIYSSAVNGFGLYYCGGYARIYDNVGCRHLCSGPFIMVLLFTPHNK